MIIVGRAIPLEFSIIDFLKYKVLSGFLSFFLVKTQLQIQQCFVAFSSIHVFTSPRQTMIQIQFLCP